MPRITQVVYYPIKSCAGIRVGEAMVGPRGLTGDRRYMLVDSGGRFLSQRQHPRMALIRVAEDGSGFRVEAPGQAPLALPREMPIVRECQVRLWRDTLEVGLAEAEINRWFSRVLEIECGLVYMSEDHHRAVPNAAAAFDDEVSFADGAPLLLISEASLADLNARLDEPVEMRRFRPNLVVSAEEAFAEDGWSRISTAATELEVAWPCTRCVLTTVDPDTGTLDPDREPLATLKGYRRRKGGVMFGQNLIPRRHGVIAVGDEVAILAEKQA